MVIGTLGQALAVEAFAASRSPSTSIDRHLIAFFTMLKDHYYKLGSELPQERLDAAVGLIKDLTTQDETQQWDYALNRLIKGLNTTRQSARYGFSLALTELARELIAKDTYDLTVSLFIDLVLNTIQLKLGMKGKDERAVVFGQLFGFQSLINSQVILDAKYTSTNDLLKLIDGLFTLAAAKSWLQETAMFTLCSLMNQVSLSPEVAQHIISKLSDLDMTFTSEGVAVYLTIPGDIREKCTLDQTWKNLDPLSKGNLPALAKALKDVGSPDAETQKGSWSPRIHFVWDLILSHLLQPQDSSPTKKCKLNNRKLKDDGHVGLKEFWKVVVDEMLFAEKASHERKFWGFELFIKTLPLLNYDQVEYIITPNFLRCLINQSAQSNRMLNKISLKALNIIKQETSKQPLKGPVILSCLIDPKHGGCWNFDLVTKSKTTDSLINCLNQKETDAKSILVLENLRDVLIDQFKSLLTAGDNELKKANDSIQKWCLDLLLQLIRLNKNHIDSWIEPILNLIILHGFFTTGDKDVSINIKNLCQNRLNSILSDIINVRNKSTSWTLYCVKQIQNLELKFQLVQQFDEDLEQVKTECVQLLQTVEELGNKTSDKDKIYSFELLFSMVLLQIYMGDEDSFSVVDELKICFENTFVDSEDDTDSSVILTEIMLSFISKKSALLRKFCYIIWEALLCQKDDNGELRVNESCLDLLYNILTARENKEGQRSVFEDEGEFGEEGEEEKDEEEKEKDDENEDDEEDEDDDEDDEDEEDDDGEGSSSDDEVAEVDRKTNLELAQALGIPTNHTGEVKFDELSSDDDDSSFESESADDDEMLAMDDQLSKIFKERRNILSSTETGNKRKNDVAEAREQMIFFKHRVLDLLEILVKCQPDSYLNLTMLKPIITVVGLTLDKNVGLKGHKLLKSKLSKVKVSKESVEVTKVMPELKSLLEWIHEQATTTKSTNKSYSAACSGAGILVAKTMVNLDAQSMTQVIDIYSDSMKKWATDDKVKTQSSLFFDFINWVNSRRSK